MPISDLIPWKKNPQDLQTDKPGGENALLDLREEMNQLFEDFLERPLGLDVWTDERGLQGSFFPSLDLTETGQEILVSAELPGMEADQIDIQLTGNTLTISGEKSSHSEDKGTRYFRQERSYGTFRRSLSLPAQVNEEKISAVYQNGVLEIQLPKTSPGKPGQKTIPIQS